MGQFPEVRRPPSLPAAGCHGRGGKRVGLVQFTRGAWVAPWAGWAGRAAWLGTAWAGRVVAWPLTLPPGTAGVAGRAAWLDGTAGVAGVAGRWAWVAGTAGVAGVAGVTAGAWLVTAGRAVGAGLVLPLVPP